MKSNSSISPIQKAADKVGGIRSLAPLLNITPSALYQWRKVPANRVVEVERITGVPRQELRPDLYADMPVTAA